MKSFIKDYFTFSKQEQRGVLVLLAIILMLLFTLFFTHFYHRSEKIDFSSFKSEVENFEKYQEEQKKEATGSLNVGKEEHIGKNNFSLFYFNPNKISNLEWLKLGLREKQVQVIRNYLNKGGKFYSKNDLEKIYGLDKKLVQRLEPYMLIAETKNTIQPILNPVKKTLPFPQKMVEVNMADSIDLVQINGIGPAFAKRILKYRDLLGGFYKKEQLAEVYGLDSTIYVLVEKQIKVDPLKIKKIRINQCTIDELKKHPYFKYNLARSIINFRQQHGNFQDVSQIKQLDLVNDELYLKIVPYIAVE